MASPFNVGTEFDEELHRFQMSIIARIVNRRLADIIPASNIGLRIQQQLDGIALAVACRRVQGGTLAGPFARDFCAESEQEADGITLSPSRRDVNRSVSLFVRLCDARICASKYSHDVACSPFRR